jgi:methylmalonyl-CoA mutase cobalamin-binding domain/chain
MLLPLLTAPTRERSAGTFLIATVKGDIHDIGKNIAATLLDTRGFDVVDLGVDTAPEHVAAAVVSARPEILGLSCLLTGVFDSMHQTIAMVRERTASWPRRLPVIIGGAPLSQAVCDRVGADGWCTDVAEGVAIIDDLLAKAGRRDR